jgi:hypothetical protein
MQSRSYWLQHTRDYSKQNCGRRYYNIHKNHHSPHFSPELDTAKSVRMMNSSLIAPITSDTKFVKLKKNSNLLNPLSDTKNKQEIQQELIKKLEEQDLEIINLKKHFEETSQRIKSFERLKLVEHTPRLNLLPELDILRNKSTPSTRPIFLDLSTHPAFKQPRFPKNRPKLHFNNPITGIPMQNF